MGFTSPVAAMHVPAGMSGGAQLLENFLSGMDAYHQTRDFPALKGASYLSVHLRFGTVSVRQLAAAAYQRDGRGAQVWLSELIWRDFYHQVLAHHPEVAAGVCIKVQYQHLRWPNPHGHFEAWKQARTGYPLVDAAMPAQSNRLYAKSASHAHGFFLDQGFTGRLASGRALFCR